MKIDNKDQDLVGTIITKHEGLTLEVGIKGVMDYDLMLGLYEKRVEGKKTREEFFINLYEEQFSTVLSALKDEYSKDDFSIRLHIQPKED